MADISRWETQSDDDIYALLLQDGLGVLSSTRQVVEQGEHAWIDLVYIKHLSQQIIQDMEQRSAFMEQGWDTTYHFHDDTERTVNWLLLLDALNFCFWAEKQQPRWSIVYRGETLNGYWAEAASLKRAVEEGIPLWDAQYLCTVSEEMVAHIFRGEQTIPLFEQRVANMREVGSLLLERFDGQFVHAIQQAGGSAVQLALLLANTFPSFYDVAWYHGREVRFLKRAQICVADLANAFAGKQWGIFTDLEQLTIFADYKLPQILRHTHVLEYHSVLAKRVDNQELLEPGSPEEIEIRACTIWACELLRRCVQQQGYNLTNVALDQYLWLLSQGVQNMRPYHRTHTLYY